jgi:Lrp/AsnC family leucine-responsive transcriptional regulator
MCAKHGRLQICRQGSAVGLMNSSYQSIWTTELAESDLIDRIDRNILAALGKDGRLSMAELATQVGLSKTPVQARVRRLERDGYIRGYAAIVDRERMGEGHVAFVQVKLSDTRSAALDAFNKAVLAVPEIEQCHMIAASFDYLLKVRTRDIASYRRVLGERISALPHVAQTSTYVAMETVKDR